MQRKDAGFTLIELLTTVAVLLTVAGVGIPSMSRLLEHQRTAAALNSLTTHMMLARMAAITHRRPTILCPSSTGTTCDAGSNWSGGWILLLDNNGNRRPDADDQVLRADLRPQGRTLKVVGTRGRPYLRYLPDGRSSGSNLTLSVCSPEDILLGVVIVNNVGRPRTLRPDFTAPCPGS